MTERRPDKSSGSATDRTARRAAALRANLQRRKGQARSRAEGEGSADAAAPDTLNQDPVGRDDVAQARPTATGHPDRNEE